MKVVVIGANGQLGNDVCAVLREAGMPVCEVNHDCCDVTDAASVNRVLKELAPEAIVNTAAYHHVEHCQQNPERAFSVNALGAFHVALVSRDLGAYLIHVSTDYVFDGNINRPYVETDIPRPLNVYGISKLAGEYMVAAAGGRSLVLRTSGLYGRAPCRAKGINFVERMLKLARERDVVRVVGDEVLTPTSARQVARQILELLRHPLTGLCHATAEGSCSWFEFTRAIFDMTKATTRLEMAAPDEFPAKVPRPKYSVLENAVLEQSGVNRFEPWRDALEEYLRQVHAI